MEASCQVGVATHQTKRAGGAGKRVRGPPDAETCGHPSGNPSEELTRSCSSPGGPTSSGVARQTNRQTTRLIEL
jgi:hypothetical protein